MAAKQNIQSLNVSQGKRSTQSSLSRWSHDEEAFAATNPKSNRAFAFHTDRQGAPFWMVDLERNYWLEKIIIHNRRDGFQYRLATLVVETSSDGHSWTTVHAGLIYPQDAVEFPLHGMLRARFVRLRLQDSTYLHVARVEIIARKYENYDEKVFLARRSDGLGERLNAMLNALWLSEIYSCDFRFAWPKRFQDDPLHAIVPVEKMFSPEFIERFCVPEEELSGNWEISGRKRSRQEIAWRLSDTGMITAPRVHLSELMHDFVDLSDVSGLQRAFRKIGFSDHVQEAIDHAESIRLPPNAVVMHLRSGDVFYGEYRKYVHYSYKGITMPIAKELIRQQREEGCEVYVIGQDAEAISYLTQTTSASNIDSLLPSGLSAMTNVQKAMYDLVLLSRFKTIIGGSSGFSRQAGWIGGGNVLRPTDLLSAAEQHRVSLRDLQNCELSYNPLQTSFAYWYAYYCGRHSRTAEQNVPLLIKARNFDPDNELYYFVEAALLAENGEMEAASSVLTRLLEARQDEGKLDEVVSVFTAQTLGRLNLAEYVPHIERLADSGSFAAAFLLAVLANAGNDDVQKQRFLDIVHSDRRSADGLKGEILRRLDQ